jgi:hypothetical protein
MQQLELNSIQFNNIITTIIDHNLHLVTGKSQLRRIGLGPQHSQLNLNLKI